MKLRKLNSALLVGLLCAVGCSKEEDTSVLPPPVAPAPGAGVKLDDNAGTAPTAPPAQTPPPAISDTAMLAAPAAPEVEPKEFKDPDGKTLSLMQYMESLAQGYERTRASRTDGTEAPLPALTDLDQLVKYRMITRLPAAPAGQKFVYDPNTGKVSLAPK